MTLVPCNLCGSENWDVRFSATLPQKNRPDARVFRCTSADYGAHPQIVQCRNCGHVYTNPRWTSDQLLNAYAEVQDDVYVAQQKGRRRTFARHLQALEKITGPAEQRRLLDVGAYTGVFVEVALSAGWHARGLDPSRWAASVAESRGLPVIAGTLDAPELQRHRFDVITMWDVIEHLDDPSGALARCFHLLQPGGLLAVHTMDIESMTARLLGRRWPWLMDMHVHYFSQRTLAQMLKKNGFEVIWSGAQGRYLSLGYLTSRVAGFNQSLGRVLGSLFRKTGLAGVTVPVNFGDLFTVFARRPNSQLP